MKPIVNKTHIEGYLYEHDLQKRVTGENSKNPGTEFINGSISIATDSRMENIVSIHYIYVTAVTSTGKTSSTFGVLNDIINGKLGSVMGNGKEHAAKLRIDSQIGVLDFYSDRTGKEELVTVQRNEGGFINVINSLVDDEKARNTFKVDVLITRAVNVEADEEKHLPEREIISGYTFNFRGVAIPVSFIANSTGAIQYFENLGVSSKSPVFTQVWGRQISQNVVVREETATAFGEAYVQETTSSRKEWLITGALAETYIWDDEETLTALEVKEAIAQRDLALAENKRRRDEYTASKKVTSTVTTSNGGFNF